MLQFDDCEYNKQKTHKRRVRNKNKWLTESLFPQLYLVLFFFFTMHINILIFYIKARVTWVLFFFSQASHLAYHYRYLPSQMHILRFFLAFAYIALLLFSHSFKFLVKKKLLCRFLEQCSRCRTRALQSRKRKRKDLYLEGYVYVARARARCRTCNCVIPSKRLNISSTKAQFFFSFFFT